MKNLRSFAFYALVTPAITLGSGAVLAQPSTDHDSDRQQQRSILGEQGTSQSSERGAQKDRSQHHRAGQQDSQAATDRDSMRDQMRDQHSRDEHKGYLESAPEKGMQVSDLMGADVKTADDEDVGSVSDLIVDENGQIVAIVVGVGGFLGMGQKDVAIGWGHIQTSATDTDDYERSTSVLSDDKELRIDVSRQDLRDAPKFQKRD